MKKNGVMVEEAEI